jgi:hypothetical protein
VFVAGVGWDARSAALWQQLNPPMAAETGVFSAADLPADELPEPVERFFRHVLNDGQPLIRGVEIVTEGEFQTGTTEADWRRFTASQRFATSPPGFVWDARIHIAPFATLYVRDAYVNGLSEMRGRILGVFPVVGEGGDEQLALGQLHRYLAETIWFPTALLPHDHPIHWQPIDTKSAVATLFDRGRAVSVRFLFTPDGDVAEVFAVDRMRAVDGAYEPTPWAVRCGDYEERSGVRIPTRCEAEWQLPGRTLPYWRGRVTRVRYDVGR